MPINGNKKFNQKLKNKVHNYIHYQNLLIKKVIVLTNKIDLQNIKVDIFLIFILLFIILSHFQSINNILFMIKLNFDWLNNKEKPTDNRNKLTNLYLKIVKISFFIYRTILYKSINTI